MTQAKQLQNALKHLHEATRLLAKTKARKRKKRANPCSSAANPRVHFPKTRRGRKEVMRKYTILRKGKPPLRFTATKASAIARATKMAAHGKLVLDGPK